MTGGQGSPKENHMQIHRGVVATLLGLALIAGTASAETPIVLPKAGQVGFSVGGGYGGLTSSGNVGGVFGSGPTIYFRLRYRMRYDRGIGLSFENQRLEPRKAAPVYDIAIDNAEPTKLSIVLSGFDLYQMFGTRTKTVRMLSVGAGLVQMRAESNSGETFVLGHPWAGDGLYVSAGAGVERFVLRSWAYDLSARYQALFRDGKPNHDVQVAAGLIFYASY